MLFSDLRYDFVRTWFCRSAVRVCSRRSTKFSPSWSEQGRDAIATAAVPPKALLVKRSMDMRYVGQEHVVTVDISLDHFATRDREAIKRAFDEEHQRRYATSAPEEPVEIASVRATVTGITHKPPLEAIRRGEADPPDDAHTGDRKVYFTSLGEFRSAPTFARGQLSGRESHPRAGDRRRACLDHRAPARRRAPCRRVRQSRYRRGRRYCDETVSRAGSRRRPKSSATASSP